MPDSKPTGNSNRNTTTPSGLLIVTAAIEWTIFFTALVFNHHGPLSVIQWFAMAAFFMGALISLIFAYLLHQSHNDPRGINWLFSAGMIIWSTAGFFWPTVAPHFSFLTIAAYILLALQISPQSARPYALPAILSLWAVASAGSFIAVVPLSLILVLFTFMAETVLAQRFSRETELDQQLAQISSALIQEKQVSATLQTKLNNETANNYRLQANQSFNKAAFNQISTTFQTLSKQATGFNVMHGLLLEGKAIIQAEWGALLFLNGETNKVEVTLSDPEKLTEPHIEKLAAIEGLLTTIDQTASTEENGSALLISRVSVQSEGVYFICLGRSSEFPMWTNTDLGIISLLVQGAQGFISEKILNEETNGDLDRQQILDRALKDLYHSLDATEVLQKTANQIGEALNSKRVRVRLLRKNET